MELLHLIILLIIVAYLLSMKNETKQCGIVSTPEGLVKVCVIKEEFDIPKQPTALCEARCQTDFDHAQLLQHGILAKSCIMKCEEKN
jgi:hypothetical protein